MKRISEPCFARSSTIHHLLLYLCAMEPRLGIPYLFWREILKPICIQSYAWLEFSEQVGFWYISSPSDSSRLFSPHQYMMQESGQTNLICWQNYVPSLYKIDYTSLVCSFFFSFLNKDIHTTGSFRCLNLVYRAAEDSLTWKLVHVRFRSIFGKRSKNCSQLGRNFQAPIDIAYRQGN